LNKPHRIYGGEYPNGGDIPRVFPPWGAIFQGYSSPGGDIPRNIAPPPFERGANLLGGGEIPVRPDRLLIAIHLVTRRRKVFNIFIPSRRRIEFLQKNITQLNVEFKDTSVVDQRSNNKNCLSDNGVPDAKRKAANIMYTGRNNRKNSQLPKNT
jgi:hypothetical protein